LEIVLRDDLIGEIRSKKSAIYDDAPGSWRIPFESICADHTRHAATLVHPIALALVTISRLSLTLSPGSGSRALRCNRHALIMQMSLGRRGRC